MSIPTPDWQYWQSNRMVSLAEAVLLSLNIDPDLLVNTHPLRLSDRSRSRSIPLTGSIEEAFEKRLNSLRHDYEYCFSLNIHLGAFVDWSISVKLDIPSELLRMADESAKEASSSKWPWGSHETELLRHLAAAANKFWKNYDKEDDTTAPKNEDVVEYLKTRKVSERTAEIMATILRADGLPTGPRK